MISPKTTARRALTAIITLVAAVGLCTTAVPAWAHPSTPGETDAQHAAADLAGTPMSQIERDTAANAARYVAVTGVQPGRRTVTPANATERRALKAADDPGVGGSWSGIVDTNYVVPVFQAMLPDGSVLMWDSVGDGATEGSDDQSFTRAMVWDPVADTSVDVRLNGYNIFCAGYTQLANGNVLVAGGNKDKALAGIVQTHIFDWRAKTWSRGPDMAAGRWYPSVAALANGEALILGGGPTTAEVYQTDNTLRLLTGVQTPSNRLYPFLVPRTDGRVEYVGTETQMKTIDPAGSGTIADSAVRDSIARDYGSFATYAVGKTLVAGGSGKVLANKAPNNATSTAVVVSTNAPATTVSKTSSMAVPRRQFTLTVLADGSVLATGGMSTVTDNVYVNLNSPVYVAERWDPATGKWATLAPASVVRQYHSAAILLPDGRVLTGGGGVCGVCVTKSYLQKNIEYFSPPYLFTRDGSGQLADRPVITAPATATAASSAVVDLNSSFTVDTPQAADIAKVGLIRLGAPTHGDDQGQRYVPLAFKAGAGSLTVTAPPNGGVAPPGYYQLVITDRNGVPSKATIINVAAGATPQANPIRLSGTAVCLDDPGASTVKGTRPALYGCNSSAAQQWTPAADGSLRVVGLCLDITADRRVAGTAVELYTCKGNTAQRFTRGTDQLIRSAATPSLCVGTVGGGLVAGTKLELQSCDPTAAGQRWV